MLAALRRCSRSPKKVGTLTSEAGSAVATTSWNYIQQAVEVDRAQKNLVRRNSRRNIMLLTALRTDTTHDLSQKRPERIQEGFRGRVNTPALADLEGRVPDESGRR